MSENIKSAIFFAIIVSLAVISASAITMNTPSSHLATFSLDFNATPKKS